MLLEAGFANFIGEWSQCDFCFTNFGVILEYLESSITTKKTHFQTFQHVVLVCIMLWFNFMLGLIFISLCFWVW